MSAIVGCQEATTRLIPDGRSDTRAQRLAELCGMQLDPWQSEILNESGRRTEDGKWSAFEVCAIVPRQNGKSYMIVARALAGALLYNEKLTLYSAHEYRTAREVWRQLVDICTAEYMKPYVSKVVISPGSETVTFTNGNRFKLIARTRSSGRGLSPDCIILDEAFALNDEVMATLLPSTSARPNPQVMYFSSAGTWEAQVLLRLRQRGHARVKPRSFAYWEWHADPTDDPGDPRVWAASNPAYGRRLTEAAIQTEYATMTRKSFIRERLGVWSESAVESVLAEDSVIPLVVPVPQPPTDGRRIAWGVDVAWDRSAAAIAAAFTGDDGIPVVTIVDRRGGAGWVAHRLGELSVRYDANHVAYDARGGITDVMERAERDYQVIGAGLRHSDYPAACAAFAQRVAEGSVHIAQVPDLVADAAKASARYLTGGWVWDRKTTTPPTALIAATCALRALDAGDDGSAIAIY